MCSNFGFTRAHLVKFIVAVLVQFAASSAVTRLASVALVFVVKYFVNLFLICNKFSHTHTYTHIQWQHINTYYVKRERESESESCVSGETVRCVRVALRSMLGSVVGSGLCLAEPP